MQQRKEFGRRMSQMSQMKRRQTNCRSEPLGTHFRPATRRFANTNHLRHPRISVAELLPWLARFPPLELAAPICFVQAFRVLLG